MWPTRLEKMSVFSAGCSLFRAECFSCSLDVLYGGLKIKYFDPKNQFFPAVNFFQFWVIKSPGSGINLDKDRYSA
jgi:hypothetical protein